MPSQGHPRGINICRMQPSGRKEGRCASTRHCTLQSDDSLQRYMNPGSSAGFDPAMYAVCNGLDTRACRDGLAVTSPTSGVVEHDRCSLLPLLNFTETEFEQAGLLQVNGLRSQLGHTSSSASSVICQHLQHESNSAGAGSCSWFQTSVPSATHTVHLRMPDGPDLNNYPVEGRSLQRTASGALQHEAPPLQHASDGVRRKRQNSQHQKRFRLRQKVLCFVRPGTWFCKRTTG